MDVKERERHGRHLVDVWNRTVFVATKVWLLEDDGSTTRTTTKSVAWMAGAQPLVMVADRVGGYSLWRIRPVIDDGDVVFIYPRKAIDG